MSESPSEQDARLVRETLAGNDDAFRELMDKYVRIAGSIAYSVVGDFHIAADMVQEAFTKVHQHLHTLNNPETFRAYLAGAVRSSSLDWIRRRKSLRRGSPVQFTDYSEETPDIEDDQSSTGTALARIEDTEAHRHLLDLINSLPNHYREVFILKHIERINYRDIASILGISVSAVEARLFRARRILRDRLGKPEE